MFVQTDALDEADATMYTCTCVFHQKIKIKKQALYIVTQSVVDRSTLLFCDFYKT